MDASNLVSAAQWIGSSLNQEANALSGVKNQVENLKKELQFMQQYLQDADAKNEVGEDHTLISHMRQLAFDAEDVIDSYVLKIHAHQSDESWFMKNVHFLLNLPHIYTVKEQIEQVQSGLKQISEKLKTYGLTKITEPVRKRKQFPCSYPYDDDNGEYVVGLEKDIPKLIRVLKGEGMIKVRGLAIVGMGGSGKTTLARKLYNHSSIRECFNCKAWVSVSQDWNTAHLLSEILRQVGGLKETTTTKLNDGSSVPELVAELRDILEKKSYLVVLDDVWGSLALKEMRPVLLCGNVSGGGKIIITSRNVEIVEFQNLQSNLYSYEPKPLNEEEGWKLFYKISLSHRTNNNTKKFEDLGKEMLRKCYGLPLAIVVLAGILNTKGSYEEWLTVSKAVRSRVMQGSCTNTYGSVQDLLALSYDDLPYEVKPCFLYLSVFPEDCNVPAGMLIRMWIAEGLVVAHEEEEVSLEEVAMQRLEELSHRFLIQVVKTNFKGAIKKIQLHDLLRDLCVKKAREQSFLQIYSIYNSMAMRADASTKAVQARRAALHSSSSFPKQISNLRSLVMLTKSSILPSVYDIKETLGLKIVINCFSLLRLLNLWGVRTSSGTLPTQIGSLIHLRYLGVRASNVTELPTSIGNLRNLLTLDYRNIDNGNNVAIKIPKSLYKLASLRHLFLPIEYPWDTKEVMLSALKDLHILWGVRCKAKGRDWFSREMTTLSTSVEKLKVVVCTKEHLEAAFSCPSLMSHQLRTFHCEWDFAIALHRVNPVFHHNQHLHKLVLVGKIQVDNLCFVLPSNLVILELKDSMLEEWNGNDNPMVAIGSLSRLKVLKLSNSYLGSTFLCRIGSFLALEELYIKKLKNLKTWSVCEDAMCSLKKLVILYCEELREFPHGLPFMATLQQLEYFEVPDEFGNKATECGWSEQMLKLPHNIGAIIRSCDSPVDVSSISKLHEQLTAGVFLKNKKEKFWVMKKYFRYYNCFILYPQISYEACECSLYGGTWECREMEESGGTLVRVGKLKAVPADSSVPFVRGEFMGKYLTPNTTYEVAFVVMLPQSAFTRGMPAAPCLTEMYESTRTEQWQQEHHLSDLPRHEWIRLSAGKFKTPSLSSDSIFIVFSLRKIPVGMVIQGVIFEPKPEVISP